jgi:hypothetical protein
VSETLTILGSRNSQLEELARASDRVSNVTWVADLGALVDDNASQPDVLLVDVRNSGHVPVDLTALKRQHPTTNVVLA